MRLQIKPGLRQLWRGPGTVQIGLDPRYGTVLDGLTDADRDLVLRLATGLDDGDVTGRPPSRTGERARELVRLLGDAAVLVGNRAGRAALSRVGAARDRLAPDAEVWSVVHGGSDDGWELLAARAARTVEVVGAGRTGTGIATLLAATGVGRVRVRDPGVVTADDVTPGGAGLSDVGRPRDQAAGLAIRRTGRSGDGPSLDGRSGDGRSGVRRPDLVVAVEDLAADPTAADALLAADVPHLSVVIGEAGATVGPLVLPGRGPCLRCLELHRCDRDPAWPRLLAQLLTGRPDRSREETACAGLTAALACLQVLTLLDGRAVPAALGATLEIELPDGLVSRREWPAHSSCGCHWPPAQPQSWARPARQETRAGASPGAAATMPL